MVSKTSFWCSKTSCEAPFPWKLDTYLAIIADFNHRYGDTLFYEYHKAKSAPFVSLFNIKMDRSVVNTELLMRPALYAAPTDPQPLSAQKLSSVHTRDRARPPPLALTP